jgi:hypothetical protein
LFLGSAPHNFPCWCFPSVCSLSWPLILELSQGYPCLLGAMLTMLWLQTPDGALVFLI